MKMKLKRYEKSWCFKIAVLMCDEKNMDGGCRDHDVFGKIVLEAVLSALNLWKVSYLGSLP